MSNTIKEDELEIENNVLEKENSILIAGCGGAGSNIVNNIYKQLSDKIPEKCFLAINTDNSLSILNKKLPKLQLSIKPGKEKCGAGGKPDNGKAAVLYEEEKIREIFRGKKLLFICAGLGGGTGSGGIVELARIARELEVNIITIVTLPFNYESKNRSMIAKEALRELEEYSNLIMLIENQTLLNGLNNLENSLNTNMIFGNNFSNKINKISSLSVGKAFEILDNILAVFIYYIYEILFPDENAKRIINVDYSDLETCLSAGGRGMIGIGFSKKLSERDDTPTHLQAIRQALNNPLLGKNKCIKDARVVILLISAKNINLESIDQMVKFLKEQTGENTDLIIGITEYEDITISHLFDTQNKIWQNENNENINKIENDEYEEIGILLIASGLRDLGAFTFEETKFSDNSIDNLTPFDKKYTDKNIIDLF